MRSLSIISLLVLFLSFVGCTYNKNTSEKNKDKNLSQNALSKDNQKHKEALKRKFQNAYNAIKNNQFNEKFFVNLRSGNTQKSINSVYVSTFVMGYFYKDSIINDAVILFYLKLNKAVLNQDNYSYKVLSDLGENSYTPVFYIIFIQISNIEPENGILANTVYNWLKNNPEYLKNQDIKAQMDSITVLLEKKNQHP